jgi:hypothetical protein
MYLCRVIWQFHVCNQVCAGVHVCAFACLSVNIHVHIIYIYPYTCTCTHLHPLKHAKFMRILHKYFCVCLYLSHVCTGDGLQQQTSCLYPFVCANTNAFALSRHISSHVHRAAARSYGPHAFMCTNPLSLPKYRPRHRHKPCVYTCMQNHARKLLRHRTTCAGGGAWAAGGRAGGGTCATARLRSAASRSLSSFRALSFICSPRSLAIAAAACLHPRARTCILV